MKITFEDKSYIEFRKSTTSDKIVVIISAKDQGNSLKKITNACEISIEDLKKLVNEVVV